MAPLTKYWADLYTMLPTIHKRPLTIMDSQTTMLTAVIAIQLYSAADEVRSLLADNDSIGHFQTLSTNAVSVISTLLTVACRVRLRRIRCSLERVEQSLQPSAAMVNDVARVTGYHWPVEYCNRAWLTVAVTAFGFLKYGQLMESNVGGNAYKTAVVALIRTVSVAGNYYVTVMFVDQVVLAKR